MSNYSVIFANQKNYSIMGNKIMICNSSNTPQHNHSIMRLKVDGDCGTVHVINKRNKTLIRKMTKNTAFFNGVSFLFRYFRSNSVMFPKSSVEALASDWERIGGDMFDAFVKYNIMLGDGNE